MAHLAIRRLSYSVSPWRIGVAHADGAFVELPYCAFARKRDGMPVLAALQALAVDWRTEPGDLPTDQYDAVLAVCRSTEEYRETQALWARGPVAPGGMR